MFIHFFSNFELQVDKSCCYFDIHFPCKIISLNVTRFELLKSISRTFYNIFTIFHLSITFVALRAHYMVEQHRTILSLSRIDTSYYTLPINGKIKVTRYKFQLRQSFFRINEKQQVLEFKSKPIYQYYFIIIFCRLKRIFSNSSYIYISLISK